MKCDGVCFLLGEGKCQNDRGPREKRWGVPRGGGVWSRVGVAPPDV